MKRLILTALLTAAGLSAQCTLWNQTTCATVYTGPATPTISTFLASTEASLQAIDASIVRLPQPKIPLLTGQNIPTNGSFLIPAGATSAYVKGYGSLMISYGYGLLNMGITTQDTFPQVQAFDSALECNAAHQNCEVAPDCANTSGAIDHLTYLTLNQILPANSGPMCTAVFFYDGWVAYATANNITLRGGLPTDPNEVIPCGLTPDGTLGAGPSYTPSNFTEVQFEACILPPTYAMFQRYATAGIGGGPAFPMWQVAIEPVGGQSQLQVFSVTDEATYIQHGSAGIKAISPTVKIGATVNGQSYPVTYYGGSDICYYYDWTGVANPHALNANCPATTLSATHSSVDYITFDIFNGTSDPTGNSYANELAWFQTVPITAAANPFNKPLHIGQTDPPRWAPNGQRPTEKFAYLGCDDDIWTSSGLRNEWQRTMVNWASAMGIQSVSMFFTAPWFYQIHYPGSGADQGNCQGLASELASESAAYLLYNPNAAQWTQLAGGWSEALEGTASLTGVAELGSPAPPAIGNLAVSGVTAQQAVVNWTYTGASSCAVVVSPTQAGGVPQPPYAYDTDVTTFSGATSATRTGAVQTGSNFSFVAGQRASQYATAGTYSGVRHFSRSLAPLTQYWGQTTCGTASALFTFTTQNIPLGQVYGDPWLSDSSNPGDQPWPESVGGSTREVSNDPLTGSIEGRIGMRGNQATVWSPGFATAFNQGQITPCDSAGPWTSPCNIVNGGTGSTTVGNSIAPLVLRIPIQSYAPWTTSYNSSFSIDQMLAGFTGSVSSSTAANRVLDACLSPNGGVTCASPVYQFPATTSSAAITFGRVNSSLFGACGGAYPCWPLDSKPRLNSQEMAAHQGTGTITNASGTYSMLNTGGDAFSPYWITGGAGTIRVSTTSQSDACVSPPASPVTGAEYRIGSFTDPTGAGVNGNYIKFAAGSSPPTGSVWWCEQNFSVMLWRDVLPGDGSTVTLTASNFSALGSYSAFEPDNGAGTACMNQTVFGGFFCLWGPMSWVNSSTGASVFYGQPVSTGSTALTNPFGRVTAPMAESANIDQTQSNFTFYLTGTDSTTGSLAGAGGTALHGPLVIQVVFTPTATPVQYTTPQGGAAGGLVTSDAQIGNASITSSNAYSATWSVTTPSPWTMTWTNLTPQVSSGTCLGVASVGCGVIQQMSTFDASFIPAEFDQGGGSFTCNLSAATSLGIYAFDCVSYNGDSPGWIFAFNPGDRNPAHAGQSGGPQIIGAINTFNTPKGSVAPGQAALTGHNLHTIVESGETGWFGIIANETPSVTSSNTSIPSSSSALCSTFAGASGYAAGAHCMAVQMNSYTHASVTGYEPYFSSPGTGFTGAPGELRTTQIGDTACFSSSATSCNWAGQSNELMTLVLKNYTGTPGLSVFARSTYGYETSLSGSPYYLRWESYQSSSPVCSYCASQSVQAWWNPTLGCPIGVGGSADPHGDCMRQDNNISSGHGEYRSGAESVTVNVPDWELTTAMIGAPAQWPGDYQTESGAVPSFFSLASANETPPLFSPCPFVSCAFAGSVPGVNFVSINPPFDGVYGTPFAGDAQTHPNPPGANASTHELAQAFDNVVENGESAAPNFALVSGQLYSSVPGTVTDGDDFYSGAGAGTPAAGGDGATYINRKVMATAASCGNHPLVDVSGPSSSIGATSSSAYTYCHARTAGECVGGSAAGTLFVNCPAVTTLGCTPGSAHGGTPYGNGNDICVQNLAKAADSIIQYTLQSTDYYGANTRSLAEATERLRMVTSFENNALTPDNAELLFRKEFLNLDRQELWASKMVPYPSIDAYNRGTFIPISEPLTAPLSLSVTNAVIVFGYQEYGQYCTTRADACWANAGSIPSGFAPFKFASEAPAGLACSVSCTIVIPAISQRVLYWHALYRNASNVVVSTGATNVVAVP